MYMVFEAPSVNLIKVALLKLTPNEPIHGRYSRTSGLKAGKGGVGVAKNRTGTNFNNNNNSKGILILQNKYK